MALFSAAVFKGYGKIRNKLLASRALIENQAIPEVTSELLLLLRFGLSHTQIHSPSLTPPGLGSCTQSLN